MVDARLVRAFERVRDAAARRDPVQLQVALAQLERMARVVRTDWWERVAVLVLDRGWSYAQLGRALGISRQAAKATYGPVVARLRDNPVDITGPR